MNTLLSNLLQRLWAAIRRPEFLGIVAISLTAGIGGHSSLFTEIKGRLFNSMPTLQPECLTLLGNGREGCSVMEVQGGSADLFSYHFYEELQKKNEAFQELSAFQSFTDSMTLSAKGECTRSAGPARTRLVSGNYFKVLGATAVLGRTIVPADESNLGANPVAMISFRYWQERFASDQNIVGSRITLNGVYFRIVGVTPAEFSGGLAEAEPPEVWLPLTMQPQLNLYPSFLGANGPYWLRIVGRLKPGWSQQRADAWVAIQLQEYLKERNRLTLGEYVHSASQGPA